VDIPSLWFTGNQVNVEPFPYASFAGINGKPGVSVEDVAENYYGNRSGTRLESALRGPMAGYIDIEQGNHIVEWLKSGAPESGYDSKIRPILAERCFGCHRAASGLPVPDFTSYAGIRPVANVDAGVSLHSLMKVSHIHLFGIRLVALGIGLIFRFALLPVWLQHTLTLLPFSADRLAHCKARDGTSSQRHTKFTALYRGSLSPASWPPISARNFRQR